MVVAAEVVIRAAVEVTAKVVIPVNLITDPGLKEAPPPLVEIIRPKNARTSTWVLASSVTSAPMHMAIKTLESQLLEAQPHITIGYQWQALPQACHKSHNRNPIPPSQFWQPTFQ